MTKMQRKNATKILVVAWLLTTITSACAPAPTASTEAILIAGTIDQVQEVETEVATEEMESETEKFQKSYQQELIRLSKEMGLDRKSVV